MGGYREGEMVGLESYSESVRGSDHKLQYNSS